MNQIKRNLLIFTGVTWAAGWLGLLVNRVTEAPAPDQGLGTLLWIATPAVLGLLLRQFGGDGWQDAGLKPNWKAGAAGYGLALFVFPLVSLVVAGLGTAVGVLSWPRPEWGAFLAAVAAGFVGSFIKNIFEEFAWRGYLTGRLAAFQLHPLINHLVTGVVWGVWHIPYWLFFTDITVYSRWTPTQFVIFALITLLLTSIFYGEVRLLTGSVWAAVLLHTVDNIITNALLLEKFVVLNGVMGTLLSPGGEGLVNALLIASVGLGLYVYRTQKEKSVV